ncbi:toll-like receptor 12 [Tachyglossus aculeatus]|uniref:toll-like receptor 12 n=1 Tax=Tachyglossus aculeatus TaxID=9261 RepID=UPI0018F7A5FE|nr:toll-like receptor 12 [Tachyglossus aculeatus]
MSPRPGSEAKKAGSPRTTSASVPLLLLLGASPGPLPAGAWLAPNCIVVESAQLPRISRYFSLYSSDPGLRLLAFCYSVTSLARALEPVPPGVEGLCLAGSIPILPPDAFANFSSLQMLGLMLHITGVPPDIFRGLGRLRHLAFLHKPNKEEPFLPPSALGSLDFLSTLSFSGTCLNQSQGIRLPAGLQQLRVTYGCLTGLEGLTRIFLGLASGPSSSGSVSLDELDVSNNVRLSGVASGALRGLRLGMLKLYNTKMVASDLLGSGLASLETLSLCHAQVDIPPGEVVSRFALQGLGLSRNKVGHLTGETLAHWASLHSLDLYYNSLEELPPDLLAALPQLQSLDLSSNLLERVILCPGTAGGSELQELDLSHNQMWVLPPAAFSCLAQLRELRLQGNRLVHPGIRVLQGLGQLEVLNLNGNPLGALEKGWLAPVASLKALSLTSSQLASVRDWCFRGLSSLQLDLVSGPGKLALPQSPALCSLKIQAGAKLVLRSPPLYPYPALETLVLQGLGLRLEHANISSVFLVLRHLALDHVDPRHFCSPGALGSSLLRLPRLESLLVRGSGVCRISGLSGLRMLELEVLLTWSQLRPRALQAFLGELPQLKVLSLTGKALGALSAASFRGLGRLRVLVLEDTVILVLDSSLQEESPRLPQYMYFLRSHCPQALELELFLASLGLLLLLGSLPLLCRTRSSWALHLLTLLRVRWHGLGARPGEGRQFRYDGFVSHCGRDQAWVVSQLLPALEGAPPGLQLCLLERDFEPGPQALGDPWSLLQLRLATARLLGNPGDFCLLLLFQKPISRHFLPDYHRLARLLRTRDYPDWPREEAKREVFWEGLRKRLGTLRPRDGERGADEGNMESKWSTKDTEKVTKNRKCEVPRRKGKSDKNGKRNRI